MPHRLSPGESRRLVRQFLRQETPAAQVEMLFAGPRERRSEPRLASAATGPLPGPYERPYPISDGYALERRIIVL